jgi:GT2 family glycosyltransferase
MSDPRGARLRQTLERSPAFAARLDTGPRIDIVVPVFNAVQHLISCLESVADHTQSPARLVVINDGSTDPDVSVVLAEIAGATPDVIVIDRSQNLGFVRTVNEGFRASTENDVVLLNSDTRVTADWLAKLARTAASRDRVATVTPLSNNATICSVPDPGVPNAIPAGYDVDTFARLIDRTTFRIYPETPTGVGFCMLVTRAALEQVGPLDADAFPEGYGEENDFCQRAIRAGFVNLIADDAFVYHAGGGSFGGRAEALGVQNMRELVRRYPAYVRDIQRYREAHPLREYHEFLRQNIAAGRTGKDEEIRVLHLLHEGGGTEQHARHLGAVDDPTILSYVLISRGDAFIVDEYFRGRTLRRMTFPLASPVDRRGVQWNSNYAAALATVCWALDVNLIHVHHLLHNTLDVSNVARARAIAYVMTLHDYYMLCPTATLVTREGLICDECPLGHPGAQARICMRQIGRPAAYLTEYQAHMRSFLADARALFAPNVTVRDVFEQRYPGLGGSIRVIEHALRSGRSAPRAVPGHRLKAAAELNVAVIGTLDESRGLSVFRQTLRAANNEQIVFHFYGVTGDADIRGSSRHQETRLDGSRFIYHGPYAADEIVDLLQQDGIDIGLQPAIGPESFSFALSEFVSAGIPVIAGDLGAQGERIRRWGLGWVMTDIRDPLPTIDLLSALQRDRSRLDRVRDNMHLAAALPDAGRMWEAYVDAYRQVLAMQRSTTVISALDDTAPRTRYIAYLRDRVTAAAPQTSLTPMSSNAGPELQWLRERLNSPRHRIADSIARFAHKIPIVWPAVAALTDAFLRWEVRRRDNAGRTDR